MFVGRRTWLLVVGVALSWLRLGVVGFADAIGRVRSGLQHLRVE